MVARAIASCVAIAGTLLLCVAVAADSSHDFRPLDGAVAQDWRLTSLDGAPVRLSELKGKAVVLNFWATWCAPCRVESRWLSELQSLYRTRGLVVLGVSTDDAGEEAEIRRFVATYSVNYTILLQGQEIANSYGGVRYLPQTFFIDREGRIVRHTRGATDKETLARDVEAILR